MALNVKEYVAFEKLLSSPQGGGRVVAAVMTGVCVRGGNGDGEAVTCAVIHSTVSWALAREHFFKSSSLQL